MKNVTNSTAPATVPADISVGAHTLTPHFAQRVLTRYARRVTAGAMPCEVMAGEILNPAMFAPSVNVKAAYLLNTVGGMAADSATPERATHEALQAVADQYGFGTLPTPKWPLEPQDDAPDGKDEGDEGEKSDEPADKSDEGAEGDESDEGEGDKSDEPGEGEGDEGGEGAGEGDEQADEGEPGEGDEGEGEGKGEPTEGEGEGKGEQGGEQTEGEGTAEQGEGAEQADGEPGDESESESQDRGGSGKPTPAKSKPVGCTNKGGDIDEPDAESDIGEWGDDGEGDNTPPFAPRTPVELNLYNETPQLRGIEFKPTAQIERTKLRQWPSRDSSLAGREPDGHRHLMAKVREELMSVSRRRYTRNKANGGLDFTKVSELASASNLDRVFFTVTNAKRLNACVQIIMDCSGSMSYGAGSAMDTQNQVVFLLATVLEKLRVPTQIVTHTGVCHVVKDWHEKLDGHRLLTMGATGGNCLPAVMERAVKEFDGRRESRHIQIVMNDGDIGWTTTRTRAYYAAMPHAQQEGESEESFYGRHAIKSSQDHIAKYGYTGDASASGRGTMSAATLESMLAAYYATHPKLETFAFGIGIDIPPAIFHKAFHRLNAANMVEVIVETLAHALAGKPVRR